MPLLWWLTLNFLRRPCFKVNMFWFTCTIWSEYVTELSGQPSFLLTIMFFLYLDSDRKDIAKSTCTKTPVARSCNQDGHEQNYRRSMTQKSGRDNQEKTHKNNIDVGSILKLRWGSAHPHMSGTRQRSMMFIVLSCESPCRRAVAMRYGEQWLFSWITYSLA